MVKFRRYPSRFSFFRSFRTHASYRSYKRYKPKPLPLRYVILLTFVFFIISTAIALWIVNSALKPTLVAYAESQSINLATYVINKSIKEEIDSGLDLQDIITVDPYGNSTLTSFNTGKIEKIANQITNNILKNINFMEQSEKFSPAVATDGEITEVESSAGGGIHFKVPFGRVTDNILLANLGPDIPVEFKAIGDIESNIETVTKEHQINSTWFEIRLSLKVGIQMLVPFTSEVKMIERNVLLASGEMKGDIPQFYNNGGQLVPSFVVPEDKNGKNEDSNKTEEANRP